MFLGATVPYVFPPKIRSQARRHKTKLLHAYGKQDTNSIYGSDTGNTPKIFIEQMNVPVAETVMYFTGPSQNTTGLYFPASFEVRVAM